MRISIAVILLFWNLISNAQLKSYTFEGFFRGDNMNVQCRESLTKPYAYCTCFDSIAVNGVVIDDLLYDGYQLDIANKTNLEIFQPIKVTFYYTDCDFRVTNSPDFLPKEILPVIDFKANQNILEWSTQQNYPSLHLWVQIEQFKWDRWVKIGENFNIEEAVHYNMDISDFLFNGENKFRAVVCSIDRDRIESKNEITIQHSSKKIKCKVNKKKMYIKFSAKTHYELYNSGWLIAKRGFGDHIDIQGLRPDEYVIKFANDQLIFKIE
ncbi:MAG: hypothetical protein R2780_01065 [Crocinitomicaceae bacterium]|nr:hypothetical protein [Crocinitomicaceae bacterium]